MGDKFSPEEVEFYFRPGGYPFLINIAFKFLGESEKGIFFMNALLGSLSVSLFFLITYLLLKNIYMSFCSAFILSIFPTHLKYSCSGASDISSLFFICFFLFAFLLYVNSRNQRYAYLASVLCVFSSYIRPENLILVILLLSFFTRELIKKKISVKSFFDLFYFTIVLELPFFCQICNMIEKENINAIKMFWSLKYFIIHLPKNIMYIFRYNYNFISATILTIIGAVALYKTKRKAFYILIAWFGFWFIIYSSFFAGVFHPHPNLESDRKFLLCVLSLSVFSGVGLYLLFKQFFKLKIQMLKITLVTFVLLGISVNSFLVTRRIVMIIYETWVYREYRFLKEIENRIPNDTYILLKDPSFIIASLDKKAITFESLANRDFFLKRLIFLKRSLLSDTKSNIETYNKHEDILKGFYEFDILAEREFYPGYKTTVFELVRKSEPMR